MCQLDCREQSDFIVLSQEQPRLFLCVVTGTSERWCTAISELVPISTLFALGSASPCRT